MLRILAGTLLIALVAALPAHAAPSDGERFNAMLARMWEEQLQRNPITATSIGDNRYNDLLPDFTTEAYRAEDHAFSVKYLDELHTYDRAKLEGQDRLSYDVLDRDLKLDIEGERYPGWMIPINQFGSLPAFLAVMGSGNSIQPFHTTKDYDDWLKRARAAVPIFDGMIRNMRLGVSKGVVPPRAILEKVVPQLDAHVVADPEKSLFWGPVAKFPDAVSEADRARLTAAFRALIKDEIVPAYARLRDFIRDEYVPKCRATVGWSELPDGQAWYAYRIRGATTTNLGAAEIHQIGLDEVARIRGEMEKVKAQVGFQGDLHAFFKHLQESPEFYYDKADDLLAGFRDIQKKINALLPKEFDVFPKADYEVRPVEAFRAQSAAGAQYQPPSADGSRPGIFYVNVFNLKAQPKYGMETLSLHEASPGHHFQIAVAQEAESLPMFRRFNGYVAYSEGWALYSESIGKELGLFTDPYQWYGRLSDEQLRAMRLVVDTGLHSKGWSREKAIAYMLDNSSMAESDVVAEVERYIAIPGQALGYKIGQLEISKLRGEAEKALGPAFDVKAFHRQVLLDGAVPMDVLATKIHEWIAATRKEKSGKA
jgi:uncharacterized protein (DUF885 family)